MFKNPKKSFLRLGVLENNIKTLNLDKSVSVEEVENFSVSIIPAWGKTKIKNYQMICKVFGIDYFTVFDNDKATDDEPANENTAIENKAENEKKTKFSTSFEAKLGVTSDNKFQKLVKKIDELANINLLGQETKDCVNNLKTFIESNNSDNI
ncbi:MAG: TOPRIM nucleotidyl transferase/hydrolase domain-containing protein [Patescibacteria group bacterium]